MKFSASDLGRLRLSLVAALAMLAIGAAGVRFAADTAQRARLALAAAQSERDEIGGRLKRVRNEENEIKQKSALFSSLQARGMVGAEQRLEWIELLKAIGERRRLIDLRYEIAPQRPLDTGVGAGTLAFHVSRMTLQSKLLHEEDLTRLLGDLRQQASALIRVKRCNVARLARDGEGERNAQLQADCQIDWITLQPVAERGEKS